MKVVSAMNRVEAAMNNTAALYGVVAYYDGCDDRCVKYSFNYTSHFKTTKEQEAAQGAIRSFVKEQGGKIVSTMDFLLHAEFPIERKATRTWRVYGTDGHRQKISFMPSFTWDFSKGDDVRIISVENSDKTGTNEYSVVHITRNTAEDCETELLGQLSDGIFENCRTGEVVEIVSES